jgi:hypothetical protein
MIRFFTVLLFCLPVLAGPNLPRRVSLASVNEKDLHGDLGWTGPKRIALERSIVLTKPVTITKDTELVPGNFYFIQGGAATVVIDGPLNAGRVPVFVGFSPGQIKGTFGGNPKLPEWWQSERDDIAINCAIQSTPRELRNIGHVVSLGAREYHVSRPLTLSGTLTELQGAGMWKTHLITTPQWTGDWRSSSEWPANPDGSGNHAAVVWIGSVLPMTNNSFFTGVRGVTIHCDQAAVANAPHRRVSGISSTGWCEEGTEISDVTVQNATAAGIGFPAHESGVTILNGVRISKVWITGAMMRDAYGMLFTQHAGNVVVDGFTIDMTLPKSNSAEYGVAFPWDPTVHPRPAFISTWPKVGIRAMGDIDIRNGHFEGMLAAVEVAQSYGLNAVSLHNLNARGLMDANQVWTHDGRRATTAQPDTTPLWACGSLVILSSVDWDLDRNHKDRLNASRLVSQGACGFVLRDMANNLHVSAYGQGQYPEQSTGGISSFVRGPAWVPGNFTLIK